ncbi:MAG: nicotinate-nucleotide adenylyltransferase [Elusimicrobiota bacterium]
MNIGIFGGSFNPIHNGHLIIAEAVRQKFDLEQIIFVPAGKPPHKSIKGLAPALDRYRMIAVSIADNKYFRVSPLELSGEYRYTYQAIEYFKAKYSKDKIYFIIGADSFLAINKWRKKEALLDMCEFIVIKRIGSEIKNTNKLLKKVKYAQDIQQGISATDIRKKCAEKKSIKYLAPRKIEEYIKRHKLYTNKI